MDARVSAGQFTERDRFIFESWGYFIVPNALSQDETKACLEASKRLHQNHVGHFQQIGDGFEREPAMEALIDHPSVIDKVRGLYGSDNIIVQAAWCTLQPAHGGHGGWHQDGSSAFDFKLLGYPIPLLQLRVSYLLTDQSVPGLGNMDMVPGSHRSRVPMPESVRRGTEAPGINDVICASAGSALIFHNAVWHRTYEHTADFDRYTMHFVYSPPWLRWADRFVHDEAFLNNTTPLRRALVGDWARPDAPYAGGYSTPPFQS